MLQLTREQKIENCHVAISMVARRQDHQFTKLLIEAANLQLIMHGPDDPESRGCLGGLVAQHPHFVQHGVYADEDGLPIHVSSLFPSEVSEMLFGNPDMFIGITDSEKHLTSKQVCTQRLHLALNALLAK